jgi:hypothetical protein
MVIACLRGKVELRDLAHASTRRLKVDLRQPVDFAFSADGKLLSFISGAVGASAVLKLPEVQGLGG